MSRRLTRSSRSADNDIEAAEKKSSLDDDNDELSDESARDNERPPPTETYYFDGVSYPTYQDMVNAKRKRNQQVLIDSGLLAAANDLKEASRRVTLSSQKKRRKTSVENRQALPRRISNRIKGIQSDGMYVEDERAGRFVVGGNAAAENGDFAPQNDNDGVTFVTPKETFFNNRINNGADVSIRQAVENAEGDKEEAVMAERFVTGLVTGGASRHTSFSSPTTNDESCSTKIQELQVQSVAKVTRDRIYSIATHPSSDKLVVAAGDKQGNIGIWNVDAALNDGGTDADGGRHEFKYHSGVVNCLQFTDNKSLLSSSYDGTVRLFDLEKQCMSQVFATYDDSDDFKNEPGYNLDTGYKFWTQNLCLDHRADKGLAFFASTSTGMVFHVDLRANEVTFNKQLSEKKINTVSLHPNGYSIMTAGLDCQVAVWDIRKFSDKKKLSPVASFHSGKSVNSAYFSPSGKYVVSTTMTDKLDVFTDLHLSMSGSKTVKPTTRFNHDNRTGRWLSTFMATWHPSLDIFTVGSMRRPREIQVYDATSNLRNVVGEDLTAVASRCCFHARTDGLIIVGGNSSGRVTVVR